LPIFCVAALGLFQYLSFLADPRSFRDLINQGLVYMGLLGRDHPLAHRYREVEITFTALQYAKTAASRIDLLFAYPVVVLAGFGLWFARRDFDIRRSLVIIMLGQALAYCIIFYRSVFIHYWHTYYFGPSFAILAALAVKTLAGSDVFPNGAAAALRRPVMMVAVALVAVGVAPRLAELHVIQIKLLPGNQHEPAMFIKELATEIGSRSAPNQSVFAFNLAQTSGGQNTLGYYSDRQILRPTNEGAETSFPPEELVSQNANVLVWLPKPGKEGLPGAVDTASRSGFVVAGHKFAWYAANPARR
jgi:hypothetical protein